MWPVTTLLLLHVSVPLLSSAVEEKAEYCHSGGGLTSFIMASIISKLPPLTPPASGVRDGDTLMRTVRLTGAYKADVPLILPSYTRLVLNGTMDALPYRLGW